MTYCVFTFSPCFFYCVQYSIYRSIQNTLSQLTRRYLRIKRHNQTFCFLCEEKDTVLSVKERVVAAANQHCGPDEANRISADLLRLLTTTTNTTVLDDTDTLGGCGLLKRDGNDVLHVVLKVADDEWESVDVMSTDLEDVAAAPSSP